MSANLTQYEFLSLNFQDRLEYIWRNGNHIATRFQESEVEGNYRILLYKLPLFFAEVFYDFENNKIGHVISFTSNKPLENYLDQIDISSLQ